MTTLHPKDNSDSTAPNPKPDAPPVTIQIVF